MNNKTNETYEEELSGYNQKLQALNKLLVEGAPRGEIEAAFAAFLPLYELLVEYIDVLHEELEELEGEAYLDLRDEIDEVWDRDWFHAQWALKELQEMGIASP